MSNSYKISEIFYSLQGEGWWTGRAAVFVRFSGCNLRCPFCDTDFAAYTEMSAHDIVNKVRETGGACRFVVLTGGEPTLQVDEQLTALLHEQGYCIAMETNGTRAVPQGVDWVTCSPKDLYVGTAAAQPILTHCNELKVVFDGQHPIPSYDTLRTTSRCLQPCDTGNPIRNAEILRQCIAYIKQHPQWRLSLQMHKVVGIE